MIPPNWRFYSPNGALTPGGPHTWVVIDWDQRRWFQVTGPASALPDEEDGIRILAKYVNQLGPDVHALEIDENCELLSISSEDPTQEVRYPDLPKNIESKNIIFRSKLEEVERMHVCTDLVRCVEDNKLVAFKYTIIRQRVKNVWHELHILKALSASKHKSFASFHRVVIDDISKKVLGFTSLYIAGGTLEKYTQTFYFRWLKQLTEAIDELNLRFGIMHQDVAPRNVLIDPATEDVKVFDFDRSALIGSARQQPWRNDVDGLIFTVYEALTKDDSYRGVPFHEQTVSEVELKEEWNVQLPLEDGTGEIAAYRHFVAEWAQGRRTTRAIKHSSEASEPISWPEYTKPGLFWVDDPEGGFEGLFRTRSIARRVGDYVNYVLGTTSSK